MKKLVYYLFFISVSAFSFTACDKDDDAGAVSSDAVAEEVAASLGYASSGLSSEIVDVASLSGTYEEEALKSTAADTIYKADSTFVRSNLPGATVTYSYACTMEYGFVWSSGGLLNMYYNGSLTGGYNGVRSSMDDARTSEWIASGIETSSSSYILNGSSSRTGSYQSKVRNQSAMNSTSQIGLHNVKVSKSSLQITEGTLDWTISGMVNGTAYTYDVSVTYSANGTATLAIGKEVYTVDLSSGEVL
ncbi:MAG: hypothetical protein QM786_16650 [Breznakibacter sp.]